MNDINSSFFDPKRISLFSIVGCIYIVLCTSFIKYNPPPDTTITIRFRVSVHGQPLQLGKPFHTPFGEIFNLSRLRFYVGKITPEYTESGFSQVPSSYYLIDFSDSSSTTINLPAFSGSACNGLRFQLGIDSADQTQGAQTGVLDPAKGMFWTWNSGYQSFKIEGYSPLSSQPAHIIAYHIGGYREPFSTIWKIKISTTNDEVFRITRVNKFILEIPIEMDYFFDGPTPLHMRQTPVCTTPGVLARKLSENFVGSFTGINMILTP
jgi:hypothetical protein